MPSRELPLHPSLRHLKHEAKQLHRSLIDGDVEAVRLVRASLPRLNDGDAVQDVSLMEVQHVLAREYGYKEWPALAAAVEFGFDDLADFSDADTEEVLRRTDQKDLVIALKLASDDAKRQLLSVMSQRVRQFIAEEVMFLGPVPEDEIRAVQERIVNQVRILGREGTIAWPPGGAPAVASGTQRQEDLPSAWAGLLDEPLESLSLDEIRSLLRGMRGRVDATGIISLDKVRDQAFDGFVREGVMFAVDGTEPALIEDFLSTRARALLQHLENRQLVIIEGAVAICGKDNPRAVAHKMITVYSTDFGKSFGATPSSADDLLQRLEARPVSALDFDGLAQLLTDISDLSRREGFTALTPLVEAVDDETLREGIRGLAEERDMKSLCETVMGLRDERVKGLADRLKLFTAGITAIQQGKQGADLDAVLESV